MENAVVYARYSSHNQSEDSNGRTDRRKIYVSEAFGRKTNREEI